LASVLSRPAIFPLPAFAVKLAFGEMGEELLLGSQKVEASKLIASGYPFRYRELRASLKRLSAVHRLTRDPRDYISSSLLRRMMDAASPASRSSPY